MSKKGLGILISGRGSNMEAIIQAALSKQIDATVNVVISNKKNALGIDSAKSYGIKTFILEKKDYSSKKDYEEEISRILKDHSVDLVCLAGYMTLVGETLLASFNNKIINIHPSLLPAFKGLNAQKQALDYGVSYAGCSVHYVDQSMDGGALIMQDIVEVLDTDTEESLSKKILKKEHLLYPKAINLVLKKKS
jgi:phosphoribosylglycinamide formyltransferase-1